MWCQRAEHKPCLGMLLLAWERYHFPFCDITEGWFLLMQWFRKKNCNKVIAELFSFVGIPLTVSFIENTGEVNHTWQGTLIENISPSSGRCSSLPTPSGHPACLPDEEVFAPGWNGWAPGVGSRHRLKPALSKIMQWFYIFTQSYFLLDSHAVNLLSALPLQCLDVLLMVPPEPDSQQCRGVNMDCVHTLLMFMERRLESVKDDS